MGKIGMNCVTVELESNSFKGGHMIKGKKICVRDMIKKYPGMFATIESAVWDDMKCTLPHPAPLMTTYIKKFAYNAAAVAVIEHHKSLEAVGRNIERFIIELRKQLKMK